VKPVLELTTWSGNPICPPSFSGRARSSERFNEGHVNRIQHPSGAASSPRAPWRGSWRRAVSQRAKMRRGRLLRRRPLSCGRRPRTVPSPTSETWGQRAGDDEPQRAAAVISPHLAVVRRNSRRQPRVELLRVPRRLDLRTVLLLAPSRGRPDKEHMKSRKEELWRDGSQSGRRASLQSRRT
jgi:hypothetical protein